jgi:hypothetical protein
VSNQAIEWELVNPEGVCTAESVKMPPRLTTLEGKTVGLSWNGKIGSKELLTEIADLLSQKVKDIKFIKFWEAVKSTDVAILIEWEQKILQDMVALKPDIIISAHGD